MIASASSGATESTVIGAPCFSGGTGIESVTMTSSIGAARRRSGAPAVSTPWVAAKTTRRGPWGRSMLAIAPAVAPGEDAARGPWERRRVGLRRRRSARGDHVFDNHAVAPLDVTGDGQRLRLLGALAALVAEHDPRLEEVGDRLRPLGAAGVGGHHGELLEAARADVVGEDVLGRQVVG